MGTLDAITDVLLGSKTLDLRVVSWRQILHGVSRGASRQHPDDHRIELQCRLHQSLLYLILNRTENEWKMPPREWTLAKPQFAVLFGERFMKALVA